MRNSKRKALAVTLALLLCVLLILTAFCEAYFQYPVYYYEDAAVRQELSGTIDTIVLGSSHAFRAFVPQILDEALGTSSYNLSCAMLTMRGRYELLKKEVARNPVKTVVLELSFNALTRDRNIEGPEGDLYLLGRLDSGLERLGYFFSAFRPSEYSQVIHDTFTRSKKAWKSILHGTVAEPQMKAGRGFISVPTNDLSLSYSDAEAMWFTKSASITYCDEDLEYLDKCVRLCQKNGIRVIFAVTPLSDQKLLETCNLDTIRQYMQTLATQYGVEFYDFNLIRTRSDYPAATAFFDTLHLSGSGAETFTRSFAALLQRVDAGENIDALFYDSYVQAGQAILSDIQAKQP